MSREIKFRAWDATNKRFVHNILYRIDGNGDFPESHTLCQYTGLKDKNGVEIYEGDIVDKNFCTKQRIGVVVYKRTSFLIEIHHCGLYDEGHDTMINTEDVEVLGNIYENPELWG